MPLKVLILDDEPDIGSIFAEAFAREGIEIQAFTNCEAAIKACHVESFDLVFLDFRMPEMNAEQVAVLLPVGTPVCLMTGESQPAVSFPFLAVLPKPFDYDAIEKIFANAQFEKNRRSEP